MRILNTICRFNKKKSDPHPSFLELKTWEFVSSSKVKPFMELKQTFNELVTQRVLERTQCGSGCLPLLRQRYYMYVNSICVTGFESWKYKRTYSIE